MLLSRDTGATRARLLSDPGAPPLQILRSHPYAGDSLGTQHSGPALVDLRRDIDKVKLLGIFPGKPAPDFEATALDGKPFKLSSLRGKVVLVDFWAKWCAPCVAELPNIKKLHDQYSADGLVVVSVSFDRDADAARKFTADKQMTWTQIWAEKASKGPLAELYGVSPIPATFLIGPDGMGQRPVTANQPRDRVHQPSGRGRPAVPGPVGSTVSPNSELRRASIPVYCFLQCSENVNHFSAQDARHAQYADSSFVSARQRLTRKSWRERKLRFSLQSRS
jgi:peroxiredoxin